MSRTVQIESDFLPHHLTKLSNLVQQLKSKENTEKTNDDDDVAEFKTFSKISKPETPKEPSLDSFGLTESDFSKMKKILYYSDFFGRKDFNFGFGHQIFIDEGCEVTNCYATSNNSLLCELIC